MSLVPGTYIFLVYALFYITALLWCVTLYLYSAKIQYLLQGRFTLDNCILSS